MTPSLKERLADVRERLASADPTIGFLAAPSERQSFPDEVPRSYQEFLREVDGAACGVVLLFESEGLLQHQSMTKDLPGGRARWFCFGSAEDYPLVIDRKTGGVHIIPVEGHFDAEDALGELDYFLLTSVFGEEYADFVIDPESDSWYQLVQK